MSDDPKPHTAYESRIQQLRLLFLERAEDELSQVTELTRQALAAETAGNEAQQQVAQLIHRMNGSGAMLGFAKVSDAAGRIEHIVRGNRSVALTTAQWQEIEALTVQLAKAIQDAHRDMA